MQISKFYTYYLKKLFKSWWFWIGVIILNVASFWWRFEVNKTISRYGHQHYWGHELDPTTIPSGNWKFFWGWILVCNFFYLIFWLVYGMTSTIGVQTGTLIGEPKENGEDAFFLSYTSPIKRSDLVWGKLLAGFTFFMVANLLYSLSAIYWWIRYSRTYLDYLFIFFQIFLVPILFFCLLVVPLFYLASRLSAKAVRIAVNYVIPIISLLLAGLAFRWINTSIQRAEKGEGAGVLWDALKLFDNSSLVFLFFALFSLLIGSLFYYLYQKNFQEKDIT